MMNTHEYTLILEYKPIALERLFFSSLEHLKTVDGLNEPTGLGEMMTWAITYAITPQIFQEANTFRFCTKFLQINSSSLEVANICMLKSISEHNCFNQFLLTQIWYITSIF